MRAFSLVIVFTVHSLIACFATGEDNLALANKYMAQQNYAMAAKHFLLVIEAGNATESVRAQYADALYKGNNFVLAMQQYKLLHDANKTNGEYLGKLCILYGKFNKYNEIIELTQNVNLNNVPTENRFEVELARATALEKNFVYPVAIEAYQQALKIAPQKNIAELNYHIGLCYGQMSSWDKALPYYQRSVTLDNKNYQRMVELAILYENIGKFDSAVTWLRRAFDAGWPKDWYNLYELANAYYELKDYATCISFLEEAQKQNPYNQDIASLIAFSYYHKGETKRARSMMDKMLELNPNDATTLYLYGLTYQKDDNMDKAEHYFEKAFKLKPALMSLMQRRFQF